MFVQAADRISVVTDTLATTPQGDPHLYVTKCWPVPHMNTLIAATGSGALLDRWIEFVRTSMIARDVVNLDLHAREGLREVWGGIEKEHGAASGTATIYHFGFDEETGEAVRFTYRSRDGFVSERGDGTWFGCRPSLSDRDVSGFEDLVEIAEAVRAEQRTQPPDETVYIGGDLYLTTLGEDGIHISHLHRFDDWADDWNTMCESAEQDTDTEPQV